MLRTLDLFSGIGGFSLGLERTGGFKTVAFCEIDPFCQKVLKKHWPTAEIHSDVTRLKYKKNVDLVTAGFPCQDISYAGDGAGLEGERSGLFWYILRTACMVGRPKLLLENVAGLLTRGLSTVLGALASLGYDTQWHCIQASHVGAPHGRNRAWIFADTLGGERWQEPYYRALGRMGREFQSFPWNRDWESALCELRGMDDGLSYGVDRIDSIRNAVVPQIPEMIGNAILQQESA